MVPQTPELPFTGLTLSGVAARYANGTEALRDLDLTVMPGERLVVVGPSGAGKSTLLRLMAGLMAPTSGTIRWGDATAPRPGSIGVVFQDPTLLPWRSALGNVALPLRVRGVPQRAAREAAYEGLRAMGIADFAQAVPAELSGGMRMRVALARALITGPDLLLFDEPFAALDEITRFRLNDDLLALAATARVSLVFVTHSIFESAYLASRVLVLSPRPGRIVDGLEFPPQDPVGPSFRTAEAFRLRTAAISTALTRAMGEGP